MAKYISELDAIMNNFEQDTKAQMKADCEGAEAIRKKVREDVTASAQTQHVDMSIIEAHWKQVAQLICFISTTDKHQSISAVKIPTKGVKELKEEAPPDVQAIYLRNPNGISGEWVKTSYEITACESKPGKIIGAIVRVPAYLKGCSSMDYMKPATLEKAKKALSNGDNTVVIEVMEIEEFEKILTLAGCSIMEAPETAPKNGKPGKIQIVYGQPSSSAASNKGVLKEQGLVFSKKIIKVGQGNKTPLHDKNYFPLITYEVVDITKPMPADVVMDLNRYSFESLFTPATTSKQVGVKFDSLIASDQLHFQRKGDEITSDYITNDSNRVDLTVTAFYDKTQVRPSLQLPLKRRNTKPGGSLGSPQFVKYDCTLEDKMADPEYRAKSALGRPEFAHIVEIVGEEILIPAALKEKLMRSGGSSGSVSKYLSAEMARNLLIGKLSGGLEDYEISGLKLND